MRAIERPLKEAIENNHPIITAEEVKKIFSTTEGHHDGVNLYNFIVLLGLHQDLIRSLRSRIAAWSDDTLLGEVFICQAPMLKLYTEFVNNYDDSMDTLDDLLKVTIPIVDLIISDLNHFNNISTHITEELLR